MTGQVACSLPFEPLYSSAPFRIVRETSQNRRTRVVLRKSYAVEWQRHRMSATCTRTSVSPARGRQSATVGAQVRPFLIALPALLVLIGILYPFIMGVYYSFTAYVLNRPSTAFVGLRKYQRMVKDPDFLYSTFVTLAYAFSATGIELVLGLIVAMLLNRESRAGPDFADHADLPDDDRTSHRHVDLEDDDAAKRRHSEPDVKRRRIASLQWAAVPQTALFSVVLVDVWMFTPFAALILLAGLRSFPQAPV